MTDPEDPEYIHRWTFLVGNGVCPADPDMRGPYSYATREEAIEAAREWGGYKIEGYRDGELAWEEHKVFEEKATQELKRQKRRIEELEEISLLLLDHVDWLNENCHLTDVVGAVLPANIIHKARSVLNDTDQSSLDEDIDTHEPA